MYCAKCKYTTFDHFDNCPKCGKSWQEEKEKLGLGWLNFVSGNFSDLETQELEETKISPQEEKFEFENNEESVFSLEQETPVEKSKDEHAPLLEANITSDSNISNESEEMEIEFSPENIFEEPSSEGTEDSISTASQDNHDEIMSELLDDLSLEEESSTLPEEPEEEEEMEELLEDIDELEEMLEDDKSSHSPNK
ncbi:hypothetical protein SAMN04488516_101131 [Desulfonauticus submarinus]|uniref:Uncharacterized protein n=1 Tax=Desulfonauticus submarinus TaxID=206665 RepID=A0A1G9ZSI2_9BACT|nr:hypothetical protein [Desulfonauticus submarinus]SDN23603.1 hypothetical protein SAMN04488516_101131 [Desulfonauticus submarinus]